MGRREKSIEKLELRIKLLQSEAKLLQLKLYSKRLARICKSKKAK